MDVVAATRRREAPLGWKRARGRGQHSRGAFLGGDALPLSRLGGTAPRPMPSGFSPRPHATPTLPAVLLALLSAPRCVCAAYAWPPFQREGSHRRRGSPRLSGRPLSRAPELPLPCPSISYSIRLIDCAHRQPFPDIRTANYISNGALLLHSGTTTILTHMTRRRLARQDRLSDTRCH